MNVVKIHDFLWEIPRQGAMLVPGRLYISAPMLEDLRDDPALTQVANVACLPGIVGYSLAMPDIHWGYGFPIGGVAAMDARTGVISPGGVGYDINCGVRLARTNLRYEDVAGRVDRLADALFNAIPAGVGSEGAIPSLSMEELRHLVREGAEWALRHGYATQEDLDHTEEGGCLPMAQPEKVSEHAYQRGRKQIGALGSGNDYLRLIGSAMAKYEIVLPDRQLAAVPIASPEGQDYLGAMAAAANFAWCNRQVMMHLATEAFMEALGIGRRELGLTLIYDVCHNIAKFEDHVVDGVKRVVCVHRKGATRAFGPGHPALPKTYRHLGQPVLIPGDMGRYSFVLIGLEGAMRETFGSSCHGAGRLMSRTHAKREARGRDLLSELGALGVTVRSQTRAGVAEEMPESYKDVAEVVGVLEAAGITQRVARLKPFAVIKG